MEQRLSLVTLAVADRARTRSFYVRGLGWTPVVDEQDVLMFAVADRLLLSWWEEASFEAEVGPVRRGPGLAPVTLAHNCVDRATVDGVLADARAAGADPVEDARDREWGGYSGYFADPDGYRWEVAWAPGDVARLMVPDSKEHG
ncbi:VOC family protein [Nocardioides lentus]|uniref:VOC family protein n=1 Tax=Nocardioides lentus TaxID=338077 RepID=A0ABP5AXG6_9ACTN